MNQLKLGGGAIIAGAALTGLLFCGGMTAKAQMAGSALKQPAQTVHAAQWLTSWDAAVSESKATGKPIMLDFTGSNWCGWCKKLKREVFDTPGFDQWAKKSVVLLEIDFPRGIPQTDALKTQNSRLAENYQIEGFPTVLFVKADGQTIGKYGYDEGGPSVWTRKASSMLAAH